MTVVHEVLQFWISIKDPIVFQIQYSMPDCASHETVTVVSPATAVRLIGEDAGDPLPPQLDSNMMAIITMPNSKNLFIIIITGKMRSYSDKRA
jgi:hypothetical protein